MNSLQVNFPFFAFSSSNSIFSKVSCIVLILFSPYLILALIGIVVLVGCSKNYVLRVLDETPPETTRLDILDILPRERGGQCGECRSQLLLVCIQFNPENFTEVRECEGEWRHVCDVHC